jgi:predicted RNA binding protein YcfA (HicA-like mRNA interferase family)
MTRRQKRLAKIKANPRQVRFNDLASILQDAGFGTRQSKRGTSHYVFYHDTLDRVVVLVTHGKNDILPEYQVRKALTALDIVNEDTRTHQLRWCDKSGSGHRQCEGELRPLTDLAFHPDPPPVNFD